MDTCQACVGNWLLPKARDIANKRIKNAKYLDKGLSKINQIEIPERYKNQKIVFHLYMVYDKNRDNLYKHCLKKGIEAKIHYPIPIYKQKALKGISGKKKFPNTDFQAKNLISFPCDQHLKKNQLDYIIKIVNGFYKN